MAHYAELNGEKIILREYNFADDPPKLVKYLFDQMNSPEGIEELQKGDQRF